MDEIRRRKLEEQLREEIAALVLSGEVKDPRVGPFVSVSRVEAARDLSHAKVYISAFGLPARAETGSTSDSGDAEAAEAERLDRAVEGLSHAAGFIQAQIGKRLHTRLTPKLAFVADHGIKEGFEMNERIKGLLS